MAESTKENDGSPLEQVQETPTQEELESEGSFLPENQQLDSPFTPRHGKALVWRNVNMTLVRACP
jgi:hypothetical protein